MGNLQKFHGYSLVVLEYKNSDELESSPPTPQCTGKNI